MAQFDVWEFGAKESAGPMVVDVQNAMFDALATGRIATRDVAKKLKVNVATARRYLGALVQKGVLESHGSGPRLSYHLAGSE